jgi:hypothetical protein
MMLYFLAYRIRRGVCKARVRSHRAFRVWIRHS